MMHPACDCGQCRFDDEVPEWNIWYRTDGTRPDCANARSKASLRAACASLSEQQLEHRVAEGGRPDLGRVFAMPSRHTFTIAPIRDLVAAYMERDPGPWVDPFAGRHSPAQITNDLDPEAPTQHHMRAEFFLQTLDAIPCCLLDPPYSPRQLAECYKAAGLRLGREAGQNAGLLARVKDLIAERMPVGGLVITCGWNSTGLGKQRGYGALKILTVQHGGQHNDTIVVVERKLR